VRIRKCSYCGIPNVVAFTYYEIQTGHGNHTRHFGRKYVTGGYSEDGHLLCDACLSLGAKIDTVKNLEKNNVRGICLRRLCPI
jgi:hypothetical protein